ncbi:MAG: hypothetical protein KJ000_14330 [Pirellulaceae bacterium]|nr:hypothetical protein [Pirellulaceae bacterium]
MEILSWGPERRTGHPDPCADHRPQALGRSGCRPAGGRRQQSPLSVRFPGGLETTTRSADYIQLYRGNTQTLSDSLDMIQKTAATLIAQLQDESNNSQQEEHRHVA